MKTRLLLAFALVSCGESRTTEETPSFESATLAATNDAVSASITTPGGKRLSLAGRANAAAVNAWLADEGEAFTAGQPPDFPAAYWGLLTGDAYVFIDVQRYQDSTWSLSFVDRTGPFDLYTITVFGFRPGSEDWVGFEVKTRVDGFNVADSAQLAAFYKLIFGAKVAPKRITLDQDDPDGYANRATIGKTTMFMAHDNGNKCTTANAEWETCWYWDTYDGAATVAYPAPKSRDRSWAFHHNGNNWTKFDAATDTFTPDGDLAALLADWEFQPLFWVRAKDSSFDYAQ